MLYVPRPFGLSSALLHSAPLEPLAPRDASTPVPPAVPPGVVSGSKSDSDPVSSGSALFSPSCDSAFSLADFQSMPVCSHHLRGNRAPPTSLRHLTEPQNRPRRIKLRDRVLSPEDRRPDPHDSRLLQSPRQGWVKPCFISPPAGLPSCQPPCYPALEGVQGRFHLPRSYPRLRSEEEDLLCHGSIETP